MCNIRFCFCICFHVIILVFVYCFCFSLLSHLYSFSLSFSLKYFLENKLYLMCYSKLLINYFHYDLKFSIITNKEVCHKPASRFQIFFVDCIITSQYFDWISCISIEYPPTRVLWDFYKLDCILFILILNVFCFFLIKY